MSFNGISSGVAGVAMSAGLTTVNVHTNIVLNTANVTSFTYAGLMYNTVQLNWTSTGSNPTFDIYQNGTKIKTAISGSSCIVLNLTPSTTYTLGIATANNAIAYTVNFTTPSKPLFNFNVLSATTVTNSTVYFDCNYNGSVVAYVSEEASGNYINISTNYGTGFSKYLITSTSGTSMNLCTNYLGNIFYYLQTPNSNVVLFRSLNSGQTFTNTILPSQYITSSTYANQLKCNYLGDKVVFISAYFQLVAISNDYGVTFTQAINYSLNNTTWRLCNSLDFTVMYMTGAPKLSGGNINATPKYAINLNNNDLSFNFNTSPSPLSTAICNAVYPLYNYNSNMLYCFISYNSYSYPSVLYSSTSKGTVFDTSYSFPVLYNNNYGYEFVNNVVPNIDCSLMLFQTSYNGLYYTNNTASTYSSFTDIMNNTTTSNSNMCVSLDGSIGYAIRSGALYVIQNISPTISSFTSSGLIYCAVQLNWTGSPYNFTVDLYQNGSKILSYYYRNSCIVSNLIPNTTYTFTLNYYNSGTTLSTLTLTTPVKPNTPTTLSSSPIYQYTNNTTTGDKIMAITCNYNGSILAFTTYTPFKVYVSTDYGNTFTSTTLSSSTLNSVICMNYLGNYIYILTSDNPSPFYYSSNSGVSFTHYTSITNLNGGAFGYDTTRGTNSIKCNYLGDIIVTSCAFSNVVFSMNYGLTWFSHSINATTGIISSLWDMTSYVVFINGNGGGAYGGTYLGQFVYTNNPQMYDSNTSVYKAGNVTSDIPTYYNYYNNYNGSKFYAISISNPRYSFIDPSTNYIYLIGYNTVGKSTNSLTSVTTATGFANVSNMLCGSCNFDGTFGVFGQSLDYLLYSTDKFNTFSKSITNNFVTTGNFNGVATTQDSSCCFVLNVTTNNSNIYLLHS